MLKKTREIGLEDFIDTNIKIDSGLIINPEEKLMRFAKIKIETVDPRIRVKLDEKIKNIRKKLDRLKGLVEGVNFKK